MIPQSILDKVCPIVLEDDVTSEAGGVAFMGETVLDFLLSIDECDVEDMNTIEDLNEALQECGIKPIKL